MIAPPRLTGRSGNPTPKALSPTSSKDLITGGNHCFLQPPCTGENHVVPRRILEVPQSPQEVLAAAHAIDAGAVRRPDRAGPGLRGGALHLHLVLGAVCASLA